MKQKKETKLKQKREELGYTCQQMANLLNISKAHYWQIEQHQRRLYYDTALKIANIFKVRPDDLFLDYEN